MAATEGWDASAEQVADVLTARFGESPARASVSFLGVDPIDILRFRRADRLTFCSLGMARQPMTPSDATLVDVAGPRAELLLDVRDDADDGAAAADVWRALAVFAAAPAVEGVIYSPGMTVDSGRALVAGSRCTGAVVVESDLADVSTPVGLITVLRLVPATADELAWARVHGARPLHDRLQDPAVDILNLRRRTVALG